MKGERLPATFLCVFVTVLILSFVTGCKQEDETEEQLARLERELARAEQENVRLKEEVSRLSEQLIARTQTTGEDGAVSASNVGIVQRPALDEIPVLVASCTLPHTLDLPPIQTEFVKLRSWCYRTSNSAGSGGGLGEEPDHCK